MRGLLAKIAVQSVLLLLTVTAVEHRARQIDALNLNNYEASYQELFNGRSWDRIILGASHAAQGINPKYLGGDYYNYAEDGAGPAFVLPWYRDLYLKRHPAPRVVLYEVDWFMFMPGHLTRKIEHDSRYFPSAVSYDLLAGDRLDRASFLKNRWLVTSSGMILRKLFDLPNSRADLGSRYQGFVAFAHDAPLDPLEPAAYAGFQPEKQQALVDLITALKGGGTRVILVQAPEYLPAWGRVNAQASNAIIEKIAADQQVPFLNYNGDRVSAINYDTRLFADPGHLNKEGSTRFSRLLGQDLAALAPSL